MEKINLKLSEILSLLDEIYGVQNQNTGEVIMEGLLKQNFTMGVKYRLNNLGEKLLAEGKIINTLYTELIQKYGEVDEEGRSFIKPSTRIEDGVDENNEPKFRFEPNPNFALFQKEYDSLFNETKEIEYKPFSLSLFADLQTKEHYPIFQRLIEAE